jgi:hypothetical protein
MERAGIERPQPQLNKKSTTRQLPRRPHPIFRLGRSRSPRSSEMCVRKSFRRHTVLYINIVSIELI